MGVGGQRRVVWRCGTPDRVARWREGRREKRERRTGSLYERARRITSTRRMEERRVRSDPRAMRRPHAAKRDDVDAEEKGENAEEEGGKRCCLRMTR